MGATSSGPGPATDYPPDREPLTPRTAILKVLNGISIAVVVCLVPQALFGELFTALLPVFPAGQRVIMLVGLAASLLPVMIGVLVAHEFGLTPIQTACVGIATVLGAGNALPEEGGGFHLQGTGLVINSGLTAALGVGLVFLIGKRLGSYTILALSSVVLFGAGGVGAFVTYPAVRVFTTWLGQLVNGATGLQPILMGVVLALLFAVLIISPVSTVGIATAIYMDGVASGTANLGVVAAGFGLLVSGWRVNGPATSLLHIIGSPKVQMANMLMRPLSFTPMLCSAALLGGIGGALGIAGTPISAGFGFSGLAGPLAALNDASRGWSAGNVALVLGVFVVLPVVFAVGFDQLFKRLGWTTSEHYRLNFS